MIGRALRLAGLIIAGLAVAVATAWGAGAPYYSGPG